jgi:hypothetical protein
VNEQYVERANKKANETAQLAAHVLIDSINQNKLKSFDRKSATTKSLEVQLANMFLAYLT